MEYSQMANEELVSLAQNGDTKAENILYENVYKLIYTIAKKYIPLCGRAGIEPADMIQECWFGFRNAIKGFKVGKSLFSSYMGYHIRNSCFSALGIGNDGKIDDRPLSLDAPIEGADGLTIADMIVDESMNATGGIEITDLQRVCPWCCVPPAGARTKPY